MSAPQARPSRRIAWAVMLSLAAHGGLAWYLATRPKPPAQAPANTPIEVAIFQTPSAPPTPPTRRPAVVPPPKPTALQSARAETTPAERNAPSTAQPSGQAAGATSVADSPRAIALTPSGTFVVAPSGSEDAPKGHTISNRPDERPDPLAMAEYEAEKLQRQTQEMAEEMVGNAQSGPFLHPYFTKALAAMRKDVAKADVPTPKKSVGERVGQGIGAWQASAQQFGKSGSPFGDGRKSEGASGTEMGRAAMGSGNGLSGVTDVDLARRLQAGQQMMAAQSLAVDELLKAALVTEVELWQLPDGALADATVLKSSGFRDFDEFALHRARKVCAALDEPPEEGFNMPVDGWRSVWRFSWAPPSVKVELLRVLKGKRANAFAPRAQ